MRVIWRCSPRRSETLAREKILHKNAFDDLLVKIHLDRILDMSADRSLESKLTALMMALRDNKQRTGTDDWEGKPAEPQPPIRFFDTPGMEQVADSEIVEVVTVQSTSAGGAAEESVDRIMGDYLRELKKLRELSRDPTTQPEPKAHVEPQSNPDVPGPNYDQLSIGELLSKLDDLVPDV